MRLGVVLGAGGAFGWAYHLGVIEGIRDALGTELKHVERVIGTSAGGAIAASILAGATSAEVLASITAPISDADKERMRQATEGRPRGIVRYFRPQAPAMLRTGGLTGLVGLLPAGFFPTFPLRRFPAHRLGHWPESLWIPSVRLGDGKVVIFGRDRTDVPVIDAVEASGAVPGMFRPKEIGSERFIDGAVASATHADLLAEEDVDTAVVASPMTRPGNGPVRRRARRQLRTEIAALERRGIRPVVVRPDEELVEIADGYPRTRPEVGPDIVASVRARTVEAIDAAL